MKTWTRWLILLLGAAAAFYCVLLPRFPVGSAIDDALYILAGKSILQGHYVALMLPEHPPLTDPFPGFPLLLAPFIAVLRSHWAALKLLNLVFTLGSSVLLWRLLKTLLRQPEAFVVTALYALNPTTVQLSGVLVSEPFFLFLVLGLFGSLPRLLKDETLGSSLLFAAALGWAMLVRPHGIVLWMALAVALGTAKRWRLVAWALAPALILWGCWLARNYTQSHGTTGYMSHWQATLPSLFAERGLWIDHIVSVSQTFLGSNLWSASPSAYSPLVSWLVIFVMAASAVWILWGMRQFLRPKRWGGVVENAIVLFVFLYFVLHLFWLAVDERYLYPILPFVLAFWLVGLTETQLRWGKQWHWNWLVMVLLLARSVYADVYAVSHPGRTAVMPPWQTYRWMRDHLPPESFVFTSAAPTASLYTDRCAMYALAPGDVEEFRYRLIKRGLTHLLAQPMDLLSFSEYRGVALDANTRWAQIERWIAGWPEAFPRVYQDHAEGTALYAIPRDPSFSRAYEEYRLALPKLAEGQWADAQKLLEQSLRYDPRLPGLLNAFGTLLMLTGKDVKRSEQYLQQAVSIRPDFALAWVNLARVANQQRHFVEARHFLDRASEIIRETRDSEYLLPAIAQERARLRS